MSMHAIASGLGLLRLLELRVLAFHKSEPFVGVRRSEPVGSRDGVDRDEIVIST